jgi:hypothetical protein
LWLLAGEVVAGLNTKHWQGTPNTGTGIRLIGGLCAGFSSPQLFLYQFELAAALAGNRSIFFCPAEKIRHYGSMGP